MNKALELNSIKKLFSSNQEFGVILLILFVLGMMVIPLPPDLLDVIIAINIGLSVVVMMVVLYIGSPSQLTTFPSILLILALLRIGITISTSRLILLETNAGHIVNTFGEFVVGGNLVVGLIIFLIITIINFIVITKGSERVAEVSARFSLDSMPGKQMSIDSDLRAGNIEADEAKKKRNELALESQLYGAMDGAMKFVKGDAIASIIDILINLVGGLIVGIIQHNMDFATAISTYSILTIGDGLVQQIPALIVSITAGMLVTRVNDDNNNKNLGALIISQVTFTPKAFIAASVLLLILAAVPGMPTMVFLVIVAALLGVAASLYYKEKNANSSSGTNTGLVESDEPRSPDEVVSWKLAPLMLQVSNNLKNGEYVNIFKNVINKVQQQILLEIGVRIPQIVLRYSDIESNQYKLLLHEIPSHVGTIYPQHILVLERDIDVLRGISEQEPIINNADLGMPHSGFWIDQKYKAQCDEFELKYLDDQEFLNLHLNHIISQHTLEFIGIQETKALLDSMNEFQELIRELLRMIPLNKISEVLQRLVKENISIRNFKVILDTMLECCQREKEVTVIVEQIRKALGRYIAYKFSNGTNVIPCFVLNQDFEDMVRNSIRFSDSGSYLSIDPSVTQSFIAKIIELYDSHNGSKLKVPPVIITQADIRRYVRSIIENKIPFIPVLSYEETDGLVEFEGLGVVEIELNFSFSDFD